MTPDTDITAIVAFSAAAVCFLIETALAVALASASALSRVALHRIGADNEQRLDFLGDLRETASTYRVAAHLARQCCLVGGTLALAVGFRSTGWSMPMLPAAAVAVAVGVLLLESTVARILAVWGPREALRRTAFLLRVVRVLVYPVAGPLNRLLGRIEGRQAGTDEQREDEQEEDVEALIEVGEREGLLEGNEGEMMRSIVDLDETVVREIMTPRPDIVALPVETNVSEARRIFLKDGHSRLPVYRDTIDDVVGVLHVRDLLRAVDHGNGDQPISDLMRDAMFVPETLSVAELLSEMRLKTHIALVVDEYGGTAGLVTLEDLLEEIVGEIRDEHEEEETEVRSEGEDSWLINAAVHVEKLTELFGVELENRDFDTVGGLIVCELGRVPERGETLDFRSLRIEILDVDRRRVRLVRVRPVVGGDSAQAGR